MISELIKRAEAGEPVYINKVYDYFQSLPDSESRTLHCVLTLLEDETQRYFPISIPAEAKSDSETRFVNEYVWAELYNVLSSLGGKRMDIYVKPGDAGLSEFAENLNSVFDVDKKKQERRGYGRCINVVDRMLDTLSPRDRRFPF